MYQVSHLFHEHKINLSKIHIQWEETHPSHGII